MKIIISCILLATLCGCANQKVSNSAINSESGITATSNTSEESISSEKKADIEKLLEMTGSLDLGKQMANAIVSQLTESIRKSRPDIQPELFKIIEEEVNGIFDENIPNFVARIVPIYHKHFTHEEIRGLISFYQTDLGRKSIRVMPILMQESMSLGQQWGKALGPEIKRRIIERFKAKGVDLSA